ncbi:MAG: ExbD/TolR family protein [Sandaracinaceae bacterium]
MGMDLGGGGGKKGQHTPDMNVTPLVDVVLVLLIIFMVITPLLAKQFWVHIPPSPDENEEREPPPDDAEGPVVVTVDNTGKVRINRDVALDLEDRSEAGDRRFAQRIERILVNRQNRGLARQIFFDAESDAEYGAAVQVLDLIRAGGAATIVVSPKAIPIPGR